MCASLLLQKRVYSVFIVMQCQNRQLLSETCQTLVCICLGFCSDAFATMSLSEDSTDNNDFEVAAVLANGGQQYLSILWLLYIHIDSLCVMAVICIYNLAVQFILNFLLYSCINLVCFGFYSRKFSERMEQCKHRR